MLPYNRIVLAMRSENGKEARNKGERTDALGLPYTSATIKRKFHESMAGGERTLRNASLCWILRGFLRVV